PCRDEGGGPAGRTRGVTHMTSEVLTGGPWCSPPWGAASRPGRSLLSAPVSEGMVAGRLPAGPEPPGGPVGRRGLPERVGRRQPQRQQADGAQVGAARGDVALAEEPLVPREPDRQPAVRVERPRGAHHPPLHGR